jgi:hypothetical protein
MNKIKCLLKNYFLYIISFLFTVSIPSMVFGNNDFKDVTSKNKYYKSITYLKENNILNGYPDGSFQPNKEVNRVEALKMILTGAGVDINDILEDQNLFKDVTKKEWFAKYVYTAKNNKIVSGDGKTGMFIPNRNVTKSEFLKMGLLSFGHDISKHYNIDYVSQDIKKNDWFSAYFSYAKTLLIIAPNRDGNMYPYKKLTRGECAEILHTLIILKNGGDTQKYLRLTEYELIQSLLLLLEDKVDGSKIHVENAVFYSDSALSIKPEEGVVKAANEISLSMQNLVSAYEYGLKNDFELLKKHVEVAKEKAGIAYTHNPSTQPIGKKIKEFANKLLDQVK